jgi:hypothetical protein
VVNQPFNIWSSHKRHVSEQDYIVAEHAYNQTTNMIQEKRVLLDKMQKQEDILDQKKGSSNTGFFGKMTSIFSGSVDRGMCLNLDMD